MRINVGCLFLILIARFACYAGDQAGGPLRSRREFAKAINRLKVGMTQAEAVSLLGQPEDVRTEQDSGGITTTGTKEIWRYGTSGHLTTATLGQVYFDNQAHVQYIFGKGDPPPDTLFEERELRQLLGVLGRVPSYSAGWTYNPRKVIQAVNLLHPLGKEKALAGIDEFLRVTSYWRDDGRAGVFLVLRTLFQVPEDPGYMPTMLVGAALPSNLRDKTTIPRFPIAVEQDIPFLMVEGFRLSGVAERPESHVAYFREHGKLREHPLVPTEKPFEALEKLAKSHRWLFTGEDGLHSEQRGRCLLGDQVLRLIDSVYRVEPNIYSGFLPLGTKEDASRVRKMIEQASMQKMRWDPKRNRYTFLDGTCLPEIELKNFRRHIWRPKVPGFDVEMIVERTSSRYVSIALVEDYEIGKDSPRLSVKVFKFGLKNNPIAEYRLGQQPVEIPAEVLAQMRGTRGTMTSNKTIELLEGSEIEMELGSGNKPQRSPVLKP